MKLNVLERLTLSQLLSKIKTDSLTWKVVTDVNSNLAIQDKEFKEFNIKQEGTQATWNVKGNQGKEIEIGEKVTEIIVKELKRLNDAEELEQAQYFLHQKFVEKKGG